MNGGDVAEINASTIDGLFDDVAGHLNAQHGQMIDLTIWLLANQPQWQGDGLWTPAQYLAWRCGIGPHTAAKVIAAAERCDELPQSIDAVRRGELSLDQLMPIVRKVPAWGDGQMVSLARRLTVTQIQRTVNGTDWSWRPGRPDEATEEDAGTACDNTNDSALDASEAEPDLSIEAPSDLNRVAYGHGDDGRWFLHADLDADLGAIVQQSLDEARDSIFQNNVVGAADATHDVVRPTNDVDGLVEVAQRSLDTIDGTSRRNRFRINFFLDSNANLTNGEHVAIPASIARLLTCDGTLDPVFVKQGKPVSVGRSQRTIPDRTRRHVLFRDHHQCQVPGCTTSRNLDIHHIIHWLHHGPTDTPNLITLCSRHHRMHHLGKLGLTGNADEPETLRFTNARGQPIRASGASPRPPTGPPTPIRGVYEHPYGERLEQRWVTFVDPNIPVGQRGRYPDTG